MTIKFSRESTDQDDIAIVGMACRYPGDESTLEGFWDTIANARSTHSQVPEDRWKADAFHHPSPDRAGAVSTKSGYFLKEDVGAFDAGFFSITAHESAGTDPMQRLLLELAYEAFENAGIPASKLAGSNTGCYVGCFTKDYEDVASRDIYDVNQYTSTGNGRSMLSNRISWFYDLTGPSMTIDTACSSSMYAFHLACQSIRLGEVDQALVGGCNLILSPDVMRTLSAMRFLSPDGKCHSFDHRANGYARGEGIGTIVVKRLSKAIADGDTIRSVIRASGLNQDGKTPGITMPSAKAQASLIQTCYNQAGIELDETSYFEAHGTGTLLGDPIELSAIGATFGATARDPIQNPLFVSSVKTNIGHQEGGAGLAGIIRTTLALERGLIPPLADFERANPMLKLEQWKISLPTKAVPWPRPGVRRASINSFGYGGANSHVILDDAYHYMRSRGLQGRHNTCVEPAAPGSIETNDSGFSSTVPSPTEPGETITTSLARRKLFPFSALDSAALGRTLDVQARSLQKRLDASKEINGNISDLENFMDDLAYTLAHHRTTFEHRTAIAAGTASELLTELKALSTEHKSKKINRTSNIAFVFTGQGAQWAGMGKELLRYTPVRDSLDRAQATLSKLGCSWDLNEELFREEDSKIDLPRYSQPLCTALQIAQVDLLQSWAIQPKAVVGHSSGEIAAAYAAGALSHEDAITVAYHRGELSSQVSGRNPGSQGVMMAVGLSEAEVTPYFATISPGSVVVACINSPGSVTLSGNSSDMNLLEESFKRDKIFARKLKTSNTAYHSHHMKVISEDYLQSMHDVKPIEQGTGVQMFSSVEPRLIEHSALDASYWVRNMLLPVRFSEALRSLLVHSDSGRKRRRVGQDYTAIVEIGPHAALKGPIMQILAAEDSKAFNLQNLAYFPLMLRKTDADKSTLETIGKLWSQGHAIDFKTVNEEVGKESKFQILVDLPPYPWNHSRRMWHDTAMSVKHTKDPRTDLLGVLHGLVDNGAPLWRNIIRLGETPWLADHKVHTAVIYPAASMITMALEAAQKLAQQNRKVKGYLFRDLCFPRALMVPTDGAKVEIQMRIAPRRAGTKSMGASAWYDFAFSSLTGQSWTEHCMGVFTIQYDEDASEVDGGSESVTDWSEKTATYESLKANLTTKIQKQQFYKRSHAMGLCYGPCFQGVEECTSGTNKCHAVVAIPDTKRVSPQQFEFEHLIHPTTLDSILQTLLGCLVEGPKTSATFVPVGIGSLFISADLPKGAGTKLVGYSDCDGVRQGHSGELLGQIVMSDEAWTGPKVIVTNFASIAISQVMTGAQEDSGPRKKCTQMHWAEDLRYSAPEVSLEKTKVHDSRCSTALHRMMTAVIQDLQEETRLPQHMQDWLVWAQDAIRKLETSDDCTDDSELTSLLAECSEFPDRLSDLIRRGKDPSEAVTDELQFALQATSKDFSHGLFLDPWMETLYHNDPFTSILLIGNGETDSSAIHVARAYGSKVGRNTSFKNITFVEASEEALRASTAALKADRLKLQYKLINPSLDLTQQGLDEDSFGLVVASPLAECHIPSLARTVRPGAHVLFSGRSSVPDPIRFFSGLSSSWWATHPLQDDPEKEQQQWQRSLQEAGFQDLSPAAAEVESGTLRMAAKRDSKASEVALSEDSVVLLRSLHQSGDVYVLENQLIKCLRNIGIEGQVTTLAHANDKTCREINESTLDGSNLQTESKDKTESKTQSLKSSSLVFSDDSSAKDSQSSSDQEWTDVAPGSVATDTQATQPTPIVAEHVKGKVVIALVELSESYIANMTAETLAALKAVALQSSALLWLTRGAQPVASSRLDLDQGISTGLLRTIRSEIPQTLSVHLDVSSTEDLCSPGTSKLVFDVLRTEILAAQDTSIRVGHDRELAIHGGKVWVPRVMWDDSVDEQLRIPDKVDLPQLEHLIQDNRPLRLTIGTKGRLDSLYWVDDDAALKPLEPLEIDVEAAAWSLNFVDVMNAMGQIPSASSDVGLEAAGKVVRVGSRVRNVAPGQLVVFPKNPAAACSIIRVRSDVVYPVPEGWSLAEAVSCPVIYTTAYSALLDSARLMKGETILIHAAAGGLGQAAIQIAQWLGAEVYATVGTQAKKSLLMERYGIKDDHIFSSRDLTFVAGVMRATNNKGVDVILNSLAGEALRQSWNSIASFGRFIEVGKADIIQNTGLDMAPFMRHATFACVNVDHLWHIGQARFVELWARTYKLLESGILKPVTPITVYPPADIEKAMRVMQTGKHSGKVVIAVSDDAASNLVPVLPRKPAEVELDATATYVLCGGFGGIGRSCAKMMAAHGARHLIFLSRSGASTPQAQALVGGLRARGIRVDDVQCDTTDQRQVQQFAKQCTAAEWRVRGLIQCAMVLRDKAIENLAFDEWTDVIKSKVDGTRNLHDALPKELDFFIMLSSLSGVLGHPGQANYCAANTYIDSLAIHRRANGWAATAIDLGVVSDVGYFAENPEQFDKFDHLSAIHINEQDLHQLLNCCMAGATADGKPIPAQVIAGFGKEILQNPTMGTTWDKDRKFLHASSAGSTGAAASAENEVLRASITNAESIKDAAKEIETAVLQRLSKSLMMSASDIDASKPMHSYGVDSLVAVEIRNWTFREMESDITVFDILAPMSISLLALKIASKSKLISESLLKEQLEEVNKELSQAENQAA